MKSAKDMLKYTYCQRQHEVVSVMCRAARNLNTQTYRIDSNKSGSEGSPGITSVRKVAGSSPIEPQHRALYLVYTSYLELSGMAH